MRLDTKQDQIKESAVSLSKRGWKPYEVRRELLRHYSQQAVDRALGTNRSSEREGPLPTQSGLRYKRKSKTPFRAKYKNRRAGENGNTKQWRSRWRAVDPEELPPITRLVLWEISDHMDWGTGDNAYPNMETIATGTGLNMKTVRTHRDLAKDLGWLRPYKRMKRHGEGLAYAISFPTPDQERSAAELVRQALKPKKPKVKP